MVILAPNVSPTGRYSISQAAALLGLHRNTMYNWLRQGMFQHGEVSKRINGRTFITGAAITRLYNYKLI